MKNRSLSITKTIVSIALFSIVAIKPALAQTPDLVGMDHIGFNVPDLDQAVNFFTDVLGFHKVYEEGKLPLNAEAKTAFNIRQSAEITHIAMLETGKGSNIELFEYNSPERNMKRPMNDDMGWYHIAIYTNNMDKSVAYLKSKGVRIIGAPIEHKTGPNGGLTGVYFETPWGLQIELVTYPNGMAYEQTHPKYKLWSPKNNR
ncbi:VOC family protein [Mucilaginibacter sp. HC2]|uniref:VOC family protein n=1 Tax=Mucilaginibacter inviolabilis TaxID=2714892 RepID=UPI001408329A|nr:VOC family protein [Mucilaginibacter inviolabilis]NHA08092.1 VOC family protein [Mucilaginibacter inviolabilis]